MKSFPRSREARLATAWPRRKSFHLALGAIIASAGLGVPARAQGEELPAWLKNLTIDGRAFLRYSYELGNTREEFNEFDIDRIYLGFNWRLWERGKLRYTLEGGDLRENGTDQFDVSTKHFFAEFQKPVSWVESVRVGLTDLPWVGYEEGLWGYRVQGTIFADRSGYLTSTDLGIGASGKVAEKYGSWQLNLVNGEGWKKNETGKHKDVHGRVTVNPFGGSEGLIKNTFLSAFASLGSYDGVAAGTPNDRERTILQAGYREVGSWTLAAEWLQASDLSDRLASKHPSLGTIPGEVADAGGYSVFGVANASLVSDSEAAKKWDLFARLDHLDPADEIADNELSRWIVGVSYRFRDSLMFALDYESVDYEADYDLGAATPTPDERRVAVRMDLRF